MECYVFWLLLILIFKTELIHFIREINKKFNPRPVYRHFVARPRNNNLNRDI